MLTELTTRRKAVILGFAVCAPIGGLLLAISSSTWNASPGDGTSFHVFPVAIALVIGGILGAWLSIPRKKRGGDAIDFVVVGPIPRWAYLRYYAIPIMAFGAMLLYSWLMPKDYEPVPDPIGLYFGIGIFGFGTGLFVLDYKLRRLRRRTSITKDYDEGVLSGRGWWFAIYGTILLAVGATYLATLAVDRFEAFGWAAWDVPGQYATVIILSVLIVGIGLIVRKMVITVISRRG